VVLGSFEIDTHSRRFTYPVWLRFFTFIAAIVAALLLLSPHFQFTNSDPALPWNEENRIWSQGRISIVVPSADQPQLTQVLRYKTQTEHDGLECGTLNLLIYPDGIVKGVWNGEYDLPGGGHYLVMAASFAGNIDPSKTFVENGIRDPSKLYFITAGSFTMDKTQLSIGQNRSVNGGLYVRGWLDSEFTATGELIITEDKKSFDTFHWTAEPVN
jgi:hypothetical protein